MDPVCSVVNLPPKCAAPQRWQGLASGLSATRCFFAGMAAMATCAAVSRPVAATFAAPPRRVLVPGLNVPADRVESAHCHRQAQCKSDCGTPVAPCTVLSKSSWWQHLSSVLRLLHTTPMLFSAKHSGVCWPQVHQPYSQQLGVLTKWARNAAAVILRICSIPRGAFTVLG
jgi:hypothetical protein